MLRLSFILLAVSLVSADIYMHNMRGSNNRLDEPGRERANANRLFDSQNNNRGGYNTGKKMVFYAGSSLSLEWTNQHSCADKNTHCDIILQYMCSEKARDGTKTQTIPTDPSNSDDADYGMHEDWENYARCALTPANYGLYGAKKNWKATNTRQNPSANRYAYECPEERDYYPYWRPTPWRDIAVLTDSPPEESRCKYYQANSENVVGREYCEIPKITLVDLFNKKTTLPTTKADCEQIKGQWKVSTPHGVPAPVCRMPEWSRDNHLGNAGKGVGRGEATSFNWTVPDIESTNLNCVLRIRYNISTADYSNWMSTFASSNINAQIETKVGLAAGEGEQRGYKMVQNPEVQIFSDMKGLKLQLAVNPAQFGRTFQDRSHVFGILPVKEQPSYLQGQTIHNINVRGKRGNIVQVYPAVEYDFVPNTVYLRNNDYVHFQWTGTNNNNGNNDGQGTAGTDRSNVVLQGPPVYQERAEPNKVPPAYAIYADTVKGQWGRGYPSFQSTNDSFAGFDDSLLTSLAFLGQNIDTLLNNAAPYFDLKPQKVTSSGVYYYMSTRNNNFSNRSHKGRLIVTDVVQETFHFGWEGGSITFAGGSVTVEVPEGAVYSSLQVIIEIIPLSHKDTLLKKLKMTSVPEGVEDLSDFISISFSTVVRKPVKVKIQSKSSSCSTDAIVYVTDSSGGGSWRVLDSNPDCSTSASSSYFTSYLSESSSRVTDSYQDTTMVGMEVILLARKSNATNVALIAVLCVLAIVLIVVGGIVFYCRRNPATFYRFRVAVMGGEKA